MHLLDQNFCENNVCLTKFRSKHSSNTVLCLLRNLIEQILFRDRPQVQNNLKIEKKLFICLNLTTF